MDLFHLIIKYCVVRYIYITIIKGTRNYATIYYLKKADYTRLSF